MVGATGAFTEWFLAEGTTRSGFRQYFCLQNPNNSDIDVVINYLLDDGNQMNQRVEVGAGARATVDVNAFIQLEYDDSAQLISDQQFIVERPMYFDYLGTTGANHWKGGHCVVGSGVDLEE